MPKDKMDVLHTLTHLPTLLVDQKLFVDDEGVFGVSSCGGVGRRLRDLWIGGYNRNSILHTLRQLIQHVLDTANYTSQQLHTPYIIGNFRTYGIWSPDRTRLLHLIRATENLVQMIHTLKLIYHADEATCQALDSCLCDTSNAKTIMDTATR